MDIRGTLVGTVLGDSSIIHPTKLKHAYCQFRHSLKQEQYALWKASILGDLTHVNVTYGECEDRRLKDPVTRFINVKTRCHPLYTKFRERMYAPGHKVVDPFLLNTMDERGFACWFFDDGNVKEYQAYIFTMSFSVPENEILSNFLWKRFELHSTVVRYNNKPTLRIPAKSMGRLRELLTPFAEQAGMSSKLPNVHPPRGFNLRGVKRQANPLSNESV